ncbi:MAG: GIY-YIG nuclease family protein [Chloroflexi bacterium]|nr:GIY-YIG nuclease family protein [Chloroflexota bacterium]
MAKNGGTYALLLFLEREAHLAVGKLGEFAFASGYYLYLGSALGGLDVRVNRHLKKDKVLRWHIDYLRQRATVLEVWYQISSRSQECLWRKCASTLIGRQTPITGFGSSDCGCDTHLVYFSNSPSFEAFVKELAEPDIKRIDLSAGEGSFSYFL